MKQDKLMESLPYEAPRMDCMDFSVESGFAASPGEPVENTFGDAPDYGLGVEGY